MAMTEACQDWLVELVSEAMSCEPTIGAIKACILDCDDWIPSNGFDVVPSIDFDDQGVIVGVDVQGDEFSKRIKVDDLGSFEDAETELQCRLHEAWDECMEFANSTYEKDERPAGCRHEGNCDCW